MVTPIKKDSTLAFRYQNEKIITEKCGRFYDELFFRYGFIHDQKLPLKKDPNEQKAKQIEMERVKKWLKMLSNWNKKEAKEKLHKRVYKGIPDKLRSNVWMKLLKVEEVMKMKENQNKYQEMLELARNWSTEVRQIDSDVNRQFREHIFYRERYCVKQKSLFNVLVAYSMYNSEVSDFFLSNP